MAKELTEEREGTGQDVLPYKVWLRKRWDRLTRFLGIPLTYALVGIAGMLFAIIVLLVLAVMVGLIWYLGPILGGKTRADLSITQRKDLVQGFASIAQAAAVGLTGAAGFIGLAFTWRSLRLTREGTQETLALTQQGQITERFTNAVEQLGSDKIQIRLGGVYALGRIAEDDKEYYWPTIEVLTACVREQATYRLDRRDEGRADIQAVLKVIGNLTRLYGARDGNRVVDLNHTDLFGLDLSDMHLEGAFLGGAHLERAYLTSAHLNEADLRTAHLDGAALGDAVLEQADLSGAHLDGAYLTGAKLAGTNLNGADLKRTDLGDTDLQGVLNLTQAQINEANGDLGTRVPGDRRVPGWWSVLPPVVGHLPPGRYAIKLCRHAVSFSVGEGWHSSLNLPSSCLLTPAGVGVGGSTLTFINAERLWDPDKPQAAHTSIIRQDDMVTWLLKHPALTVGNPKEVQIGGLLGTQVDVKVRSDLDEDRYHLGMHRRSIPLITVNRAWPTVLIEGYRNQITVLDVDGDTIMIILETLPKEYDQFLSKAQEILATVEWEGLP
jgi:hypothetical protein